MSVTLNDFGMGITNMEGIAVVGILFEIIGFYFLLPRLKEKMEQKFGMVQVIDTVKLKLGVYFRQKGDAIGMFLVMFGLVLQIISLMD